MKEIAARSKDYKGCKILTEISTQKNTKAWSLELGATKANDKLMHVMHVGMQKDPVFVQGI